MEIRCKLICSDQHAASLVATAIAQTGVAKAILDVTTVTVFVTGDDDLATRVRNLAKLHKAIGDVRSYRVEVLDAVA